MILKAKYSSVCSLCRSAISVGEVIEWESGEKPRHRACSRPTSPWAIEIEDAIEGLRVSKNSMARVVKEEPQEQVYTEAYVRKMMGKK